MSKAWSKVKPGEWLRHREEIIKIDDFICHVSEFLVVGIDAKGVGFGIVPENLDERSAEEIT